MVTTANPQPSLSSSRPRRIGDSRLMALRQALNVGGYSSVQFRPDGDAIMIWGTVPSDFDLSRVEMICMTLGFSKLEVHLQVTDNDGTG